MTLNPLGSIVVGLLANRQLQRWLRLLASLAGTALVTFLGIFGLTVLSAYPTVGAAGALVLGLGTASISTSVTVLWLWRRHPLTKGIPIAVPARVEDELNKALGEGMTLTNLEDK